jgi:hypothetical protein
MAAFMLQALSTCSGQIARHEEVVLRRVTTIGAVPTPMLNLRQPHAQRRTGVSSGLIPHSGLDHVVTTDACNGRFGADAGRCNRSSERLGANSRRSISRRSHRSVQHCCGRSPDRATRCRSCQPSLQGRTFDLCSSGLRTSIH